MATRTGREKSPTASALRGGATREPTLSAREASARLGVKPETLYAYVARGLLRSVAGGQGRAKRYSMRQIESLLEKKKTIRSPAAAARAALFWGARVIESSVSTMEGGRLLYRGVDAAELARTATFEEVCGLLWAGERGTSSAWEEAAPALPGETRGILEESAPLDRLAILVPIVATLDPGRRADAKEEILRKARGLIRALAAHAGPMVGQPTNPAIVGQPTIAGELARSFGCPEDPRVLRALDTVLVASAEHELNASTFAARVAASTGADPYAVISAGIAAISGPKHGRACDAVVALCRKVGAPERAHAALEAMALAGEPLLGFRHKLYPEGDPRTQPLLDAAREVSSVPGLPGSPARPSLETVLAVAEAMQELDLGAPTVDYGLVAVATALGLPEGAETALFAVGRAAGWIAHTLEQYAMDTVIRPRARYRGPPP